MNPKPVHVEQVWAEFHLAEALRHLRASFPGTHRAGIDKNGSLVPIILRLNLMESRLKKVNGGQEVKGSQWWCPECEECWEDDEESESECPGCGREVVAS